MQAGVLRAEIVGVVSNHASGGIYRHANETGIPFFHLQPPWDADGYLMLSAQMRADWHALSGWLKPVRGLNPRTTFNIHPGPLPRFGGRGMYGHHVHAAVLEAYQRGEIERTEVCMHFVTEKYDEGPVFFRRGVEILHSDTPETLAARVNAVEHAWQSRITDLVVNSKIRWDGEDPASLVPTPLIAI